MTNPEHMETRAEFYARHARKDRDRALEQANDELVRLGGQHADTVAYLRGEVARVQSRLLDLRERYDEAVQAEAVYTALLAVLDRDDRERVRNGDEGEA